MVMIMVFHTEIYYSFTCNYYILQKRQIHCTCKPIVIRFSVALSKLYAELYFSLLWPLLMPFYVYLLLCSKHREKQNYVKWNKLSSCLFRGVHSIFGFIFWLPYCIDLTNWWGIKVGLRRHKQQTKFNNAFILYTLSMKFCLPTVLECNVQVCVKLQF